MVHISLFLENERYHNILFFYSDNEESLETIKNAFQMPGEISSLREYPLIIKELVRDCSANFLNYKHFLFRTLYENDIPHEYSEKELMYICRMLLTKKTYPAFSKHPHKWIRFLVDSINDGKLDGITFTDNENVEVVSLNYHTPMV